jgi:hypothetical protein
VAGGCPERYTIEEGGAIIQISYYVFFQLE